MTLAIARERPDTPEALALIAASDAYSLARYPAEGHFGTDASRLLADDVTFLVARLDGRAVGCVALKRTGPSRGELKRMFVDDAARGKGVARALLAALDALAAEAGITRVDLETGPLNTEALAFYRRAGFAECGPFPPYEANPWSLFMTRSAG